MATFHLNSGVTRIGNVHHAPSISFGVFGLMRGMTARHFKWESFGLAVIDQDYKFMYAISSNRETEIESKHLFRLPGDGPLFLPCWCPGSSEMDEAFPIFILHQYLNPVKPTTLCPLRTDPQQQTKVDTYRKLGNCDYVRPTSNDIGQVLFHPYMFCDKSKVKRWHADSQSNRSSALSTWGYVIASVRSLIPEVPDRHARAEFWGVACFFQESQHSSPVWAEGFQQFQHFFVGPSGASAQVPGGHVFEVKVSHRHRVGVPVADRHRFGRGPGSDPRQAFQEFSGLLRGEVGGFLDAAMPTGRP